MKPDQFNRGSSSDVDIPDSPRAERNASNSALNESDMTLVASAICNTEGVVASVPAQNNLNPSRSIKSTDQNGSARNSDATLESWRTSSNAVINALSNANKLSTRAAYLMTVAASELQRGVEKLKSALGPVEAS